MSRTGVPIVALVGRQNVGKSTLVNRLVGRREAISHEMPGVTRDRLEIETDWRGRSFVLVDTGGYRFGARGVEALVMRHAGRAAEEADLVLLVVDGGTGPLEEDAALARTLRRSRAPVLLVVNKVDRAEQETNGAAFQRLGLGEPLAVSALHGRGSGDLLDRIVALLPDTAAREEPELEPAFAVVGRPNVGKSSLFNRLVGSERSVVFEEAGTTRDSVDAIVQWPSGPVRFVDTAGFRKPSKARGVEYYSSLRAARAIERAHVAVLVLDATEGLTSEDRRIAARVIEVGRGLLLVANKWDLVEEKDLTYQGLRESASIFASAPVVRTSALTGAGISRLPSRLKAVQERWSHRAPTAEVNRILREAQGAGPAPSGAVYVYGTQVSSGPPTFVLFGGRAPGASYGRFLESSLRRSIGLEGVPVRLRFRSKGRRRKG
jgi:GTP-binding protein